MWLFVIFVAVPLIEIALFIQVGGWLTLWPTLAVVIATAAIGTVLVRRQGIAVLRQAQRALDELGDPLAPLAHGALILLAGALLLTPGFLTDAVGFVLLVPAVRTSVLAWALRNGVHLRVFGAPGAGPRRPTPGRADVIEPEFRDVTGDDTPRSRPTRRTPQEPSPWQRPPEG